MLLRLLAFNTACALLLLFFEVFIALGSIDPEG